jgi:hypothetical protein
MVGHIGFWVTYLALQNRPLHRLGKPSAKALFTRKQKGALHG